MSSLNNIALAYQSCSDSDVEEKETNKIENQQTVPIIQTQNSIVQQYRTEKVLSSCEETDSEDDSSNSSSSDSSSDSDSLEIVNNNNNNIKINNTNIARRTKQIQSEFDDLPRIEDLKISVSEDLCDELGKIDKVVEQLVIIKPNVGKPTLDLDTVLFVKKGEKALGEIFDVFGPVSEPNYCVRFNSSEHIQERDIKVGMPVYYCPNTEYTSFVFLQDLIKMKGCDTVGEDEPPEFSDDEEEQAYYENLKQANKYNSSTLQNLKQEDKNNSSTSQNQQCMPRSRNRPRERANWKSNHPWNGNASFQRRKQERQQIRRNSSHFYPAQNQLCPSNNPSPQYSYQNMHWSMQSSIPRNMSPMPNRYAEYRAPFNGAHFSQYGNYNLSNADQYYQSAKPNFQGNEMLQYPRVPFGAPPRFNVAFSPYSQHSNVSFSYTNIQSYQNYAGPSMPMNTFWQSSVPSQSSDMIDMIDTIVDQISSDQDPVQGPSQYK